MGIFKIPIYKIRGYGGIGRHARFRSHHLGETLKNHNKFYTKSLNFALCILHFAFTCGCGGTGKHDGFRSHHLGEALKNHNKFYTKPLNFALCILHFAFNTRVWWNWQTRWVQVPLERSLQVRVLSPVPKNLKSQDLRFLFFTNKNICKFGFIMFNQF